MPTAATVVSLSKELYSHCSSPPADLAIAGEANAKLYMYHLMIEVLVVGPRAPIPSFMFSPLCMEISTWYSMIWFLQDQ